MKRHTRTWFERCFLAIGLLLAGSTTQLYAQKVAESVPFTSATPNSKSVAYKIPHGTFIPLFPETEEPTLFDVSDDDKRFITLLTLPKGSAFGGIQFNNPGVVQGWNFPNAKGDITILLGNNGISDDPKAPLPVVQRISVVTWKNPSLPAGPPLKPLKVQTMYLDILPELGRGTPVPTPTPIVVPTPTPITYTGKCALAIFEQSEAATKQRGEFFASKELRAFLADKLIEYPRIVEPNNGTNVPADLKVHYQMFLDAKSTLPYFFLVAAQDQVVNGVTTQKGTILKQGPIASDLTPAQFIEKLK